MKNKKTQPLGTLAWLDVVFELKRFFGCDGTTKCFFLEGEQHVHIFAIGFGGSKERAWTWKLHKAMSSTEGQPENFSVQKDHIPHLYPLPVRAWWDEPRVCVFTALLIPKWFILAYHSFSRNCHVFGKKRSLFYLQWVLYDWRWGLDRSRYVLLHAFVVWQMSKWFGDGARFLENHTLDALLFWPFSGGAIFLSQVSMLTTCLLGLSPLEPDTVLGVALQGCRGEVMEICSPSARGSVPSFLASACCDCHSDGTRVTAAYTLSYILLQDPW